MPPAADLEVERDCPADDPLGRLPANRPCKPIPPPEIVTSAQVAAEYDIAVEVWGQRGWSAVARICRWAKANGAEDLDCPPAETP